MRKLALSIVMALTASLAFGQHFTFTDQDTTSAIHLQKGPDRLSCFYKTTEHDELHTLYRMTSLDTNLQVIDTASFRIPGTSKELASNENELYSYYLFRTLMKERLFFVILVYDKRALKFHSFVKTNEDFDKLVNKTVSLGDCRMVCVRTTGVDAAKMVIQPWGVVDSRNRLGPVISFSLIDGTLLSSIKIDGTPLAIAIVNGAIVTITSDYQSPLKFQSIDVASGTVVKSVSLCPDGKRRTLSSFAMRDNYVYITGMQANQLDQLYKNSLFFMTAMDVTGKIAFDKVDQVDRLPNSRIHMLQATRNASDEIVLIGETYRRNYTNFIGSEVAGNALGTFSASVGTVKSPGNVNYIVESVVTVRMGADGTVRAFHSFPVKQRKVFSTVYTSGNEVFLRNYNEIQHYNANDDGRAPQPYMTGVDAKMLIIAWKGRLLGCKTLPKTRGTMLSVIHIR